MASRGTSVSQEMSNLNIKSETDKIKLPVDGTVIRRIGTRYVVQLPGSSKLVRFDREKSGISILDKIKIFSIVNDEVRVFEEIERKPSSIEFVGITEIVSPSLVKVVGPRCPLPVLVRLPPHNEAKTHNLLAAHVGKIPEGLKVVLSEDKDYIATVDETTPAECITSDMCYFVGVRSLTEQERVYIYSPGVMQNVAEKANQYIRDVYIVLERMNEHLEREKAKEFTIEKELTLRDLNQRDASNRYRSIIIPLTSFETKRCLRSKGDSPWKTGEELILTHSKLRTGKEMHSISVDIVKIEILENYADVHLAISRYSNGVLNLINRMNVDFGDEMFKIGPHHGDQCSIADVIEKNFETFLNNKPMFHQWLGKSLEQTSNKKVDAALQPFHVNGRILDAFQLRAFRSAIATPGFTTVSAPPGSGKTLLISGILKESSMTSPDVRFCVSSKTNVSVANAIETTYENYPELRVCRDFSLYYSRRHKMSQMAMQLSLREMTLNPPPDVRNSKLFSIATTERLLAVNRLNTSGTLTSGLHYLESRRQADMAIRNAFLDVYKPVAMGATTSLMTRTIRRGITRLIIDEAAMMSPSHALALYCCMPDLTHVTLLGDSNQLKPFCLLNEDSFSYTLLTRGELSRLDEFDSTNKERLNTVYRCHPSIVDNILRPLYHDDLRAGVAAKQRGLATEKDLVRAKDGTPYLFIHTDESTGTFGYNKEEIIVALTLLDYLIVTKQIPCSDIAVICHHKAQQHRLNSAMRGHNYELDVQTIDSFQGKEAKIVLVLTTKTTRSLTTARQTLSFVSDVHRETVAVSRAQHMMYLLGDWRGLMETTFWGKYRPMIRDNGAMMNSQFKYISPDFDTVVTNK